jgi:hypothetical protein
MLSSFHAAYSVGGLIGASVGALVAGVGGRPFAQFALVSVLLALVWVPVAPKRLHPQEQISAATAVEYRLRSLPSQVPAQLVLLGSLAFCSFFAEGAAADWSAVYLQGTVGAGMALGALAYAGFSLAMTASRLGSDRAGDRFGPVIVTRLGGLIAGTGLGIALALQVPLAGVAGFICLGAGLAPIAPNVFRAAASTRGTSPGIGIATGTTVGYLGFLLGPPVIGAVGHAFGLSSALWLVVLMCGLITSLASATCIAHICNSAPTGSS